MSEELPKFQKTIIIVRPFVRGWKIRIPITVTASTQHEADDLAASVAKLPLSAFYTWE